MDIAIFYFSGTGNTWWCGEELKKELEIQNKTVAMYSLENSELKKSGAVEKIINDVDHVIIGYPTYGSDLPNNMRDFVNGLPKVQGNRKFSVFCTQAAFTGDGNIYFKEAVEQKGYKFLQSIQINMTTNFNVAMLPFSLSKPASGKKLEKKKAKALKKIKKLAIKINEEQTYIEGRRFYQILGGRIQRYFFRKEEKKFPIYFKFIKENCVNCNLCVKNCPTKNLFFNDSEELDWMCKDNCILCFRCYNFCPNNAIAFGKKIKSPDKCVRYKGPIKGLKLSDITK